MPPSPNLRCGPSGWAYSDWNAVVYPRVKPRGFHPLAYLSSFFDLFEINASRESALRPEVARLWLNRAGPKPVFTIVLGSRFTRERDLDPVAVRDFKEGLWPFLNAGRLGCLLMEFPWAFRFTKENREFLIRLRRQFHEFPLAAEMRHSSWMLDEALGTLMDYHIGFCNLDQPVWTHAMPPAAFITAGVGYVRLHGKGENYLYSVAELEAWKRRIERIAAHTNALYVVTANSAEGRSVVNALQLQALLGLGPLEAPCELVRHYPDELTALQARSGWRVPAA